MTDNDLIKEIKDNFEEAHTLINPSYEEAVDDLNFAFIPGSQWPQKIRAERIRDGRPCFEINKLPYYLDQVIGDIRMNEPSITVKPVDSVADPKTAEILNGLIKSIENFSNAEIAYDTASESAVACGFGAWRIVTDYAQEDSFEQDILIKRIRNPFTIWWGPAEEWDRSDASYCLVTERMPKEKFQRLYPKASLMPFESSHDRSILWGDDKQIRIAEYFVKEIEKRTLYLMKNPESQLFTTFETPNSEILAPLGWEVVRERKIDSQIVKWCKANQSEILEKQTVWPGRLIPIIMLYGKEVNIEGQSFYRGMVRYGKEPARLYNMGRSTEVEVIALAPKVPYLVTSKMIEKYQDVWKNAHKKNYPYLPYDTDPDSPTAKPTREPPVTTNTGISELIAISDQEIHDTVGLQQASLGQKSNEKSGKAILARAREGDTAQYPYYDNLGRALRYSGKVMLDLIPKIYDTERIVRVIGKDNEEKLIPINQSFQDKGDKGEAIQRIYDVTVGKYDVTVSIGPSFSTQREEAATNMMKFIEAVPQAGPLLGDLLAKNLDWPGAQEVERRLKSLLPPQLQVAEGEQPPPSQPNMADLIKQKGEAAKVQGRELENEKRFLELQRNKAGGGINP